MGGGNLHRQSLTLSRSRYLFVLAEGRQEENPQGDKKQKTKQNGKCEKEDEEEMWPEAGHPQGVPGGISGHICPDSEYLPLHLSYILNSRFKAANQYANNLSNWVCWDSDCCLSYVSINSVFWER